MDKGKNCQARGNGILGLPTAMGADRMGFWSGCMGFKGNWARQIEDIAHSDGAKRLGIVLGNMDS